jgi:hypothetical protein
MRLNSSNSNAQTATVNLFKTRIYLLFTLKQLSFFFKDLFAEPTVSPFKQVATEGSSTQFVCKEAPHARLPDRYVWLAGNSNNNNEETATTWMSSGSILELNNITTAHTGAYICCLIYSPVSSLARANLFFEQDDTSSSESSTERNNKLDDKFIRYCSSGHLEVRVAEVLPIASKSNLKTGHVFLIVACVCLVLLIITAVLAFFCYKKLRVISNAQKAVTSLKEVN